MLVTTQNGTPSPRMIRAAKRANRMRKLRAQGLSYEKIAKIVGVSAARVGFVIRDDDDAWRKKNPVLWRNYQKWYRDNHPKANAKVHSDYRARNLEKIKARGRRKYAEDGRELCPLGCGNFKSKRSGICRACWRARTYLTVEQLDEKHRTYMREYMRSWRTKDGPAQEAEQIRALQKRPVALPICRAGKRTCENAGRAHRHCECLEPIGLDEVACKFCIAEQANVERMMAGKRIKGDGLEDAA